MLKRAFIGLPSWLKAAMKRGVDEQALRARHRAACRQLVRAAAGISDGCLKDIRTVEDWRRRRPDTRRQLQSMLGLDPLPERTPLHMRVAGVVERAGYAIEKIVFESMPGLFVTANFYLPRKPAAPVPCVVYLNGHWPSLDGAKIGFQDRYLWYPANGFALLVVDPMGFGEIPGVHPGMNRLGMWHWLSLGYTPAGVEVWNAMRALDWLETRPEIDAARLGVTGISGGGVMTQYLAALDERVAVAAPSCSTYTLGTQAARDLVPQQCDCTFYPNVFRVDFPEVLSLIAPRPLLILGGRKDPVFPPAGFREAFRQAKRVYDLYDEPPGSDPRIRLVESGQGHTDPPHFLRETHEWMCRWLRDPSSSRPGGECAGLPPEPPEILRCTEKIPPAALNDRIHDIWIRRPALAVPATPESWASRKDVLLGVLRTRVFGWFPRSEIPFKTRRFAFSGGYAGECADFGEFEFDSEPGVPLRACLLKPRRQSGPVPLIVWIRGPAEHVLFPDLDEYFPVLRTYALAIVTPRFAERPLSGYEQARIERTAALTGRSMAALQVWDALRAVSWATREHGIDPSGVAVYGRGHAGIVGLYAALFDPAIGHVVLRDPPRSHLDGPALPTILRDTDIEEVAGMLAPGRLTLLSNRPDGFELTRSIYDLVGSGKAFRRASSLADALLGGASASPARPPAAAPPVRSGTA